MNVFSHFEGKILDAVKQLQSEGVISEDMVWKGVSVEAPRDETHGDIATNVAMVLARFAKMKPRDLAEHIATQLKQGDDIEKVDIAGPGFINLTISQSFWHQIITDILAHPKTYGRSEVGAGEKVNLEFVSANPTGPMHVGHCRGAVFGDALGRLLDFAGYDVTREYYINDAGNQVNVLARSAYIRYCEAAGQTITEIAEGLYPGDYLKPVGEVLFEKYGDRFVDKDEADWLDLFKDFSIDAMMDSIRGDLKALDITFDVYFSERSLIQGDKDVVRATIEELQGRDIVYEGTLPPPKGKLLEDWDEREQTLFRSTNYGDDVDRALVKADGSYTYFATDMAYHRDKFNRGFKTMIDVWGADHSGYIKRMKAAVKALSNDEGTLDVKICQLVNLMRDGVPLKMSKRAGTFVTLREVVDEVGKDVVRFIMLFRKNDAALDFDFAKVVEMSRENPVFYVQYAHARTQSVLHRKLPEMIKGMTFDSLNLDQAELGLLVDDAEIRLMKRLAQYPKTVESAALAHEPHRIAFFLNDLASDFHSLYNKGTDIPHLRFISEENTQLTIARMAMVAATATVIASGLQILGVEPVDEMR